MLGDYGLIGIYLLLAILIPASMLLIPFALSKLKVAPHNPNPIKNATYECGLETHGDTWVRFHFRFYFFAFMFVLFDVASIFLFPWAMRVRVLDWAGLIVVAVFVAILVVGLVYAWKKKVLEWS
ncbi:MAG: NADH-quinone oxidoreductase subunit A [Chloroflexi bacterium]|nr:NADH-quinone oxidoreductase subunit A [Chloroflexota bacterium]